MKTTIVTLLCSATFAGAFSSLTTKPTFEEVWDRHVYGYPRGNSPNQFDDWFPKGRQAYTQFDWMISKGDDDTGTYYPSLQGEHMYGMMNSEMLFRMKTISKGTKVLAWLQAVNKSGFYPVVSFWSAIRFPDDDSAFPTLARKGLFEFLNPEQPAIYTTDGVIVIMSGKPVIEYYWNNMDENSKHRVYSGTKMYCGIMAAKLVAEGELNASALVTEIVPDLKGSGYVGATVRQVMDMTAAIQWNEETTECDGGSTLNEKMWSTVRGQLEAGEEISPVEGCEFIQYNWVNGLHQFMPSIMNEYFDGKTFTPPGAKTIQEYLTRLKPHPTEKHGGNFTYRTAHTDVLAWIVSATLAKMYPDNNPVKYFSQEIWSKLGQISDAQIVYDSSNVAYWGAGSAVTLRDYANFGEMLLNGGKNKYGTQVVPTEVVEDLFNPEVDPPPLTPMGTVGFKKLFGMRSQFFKHGDALIQMGYYGQWVYIHPAHECVLATFRHDNCFATGCNGTAPTMYETFDAFEYLCKKTKEYKDQL